MYAGKVEKYNVNVLQHWLVPDKLRAIESEISAVLRAKWVGKDFNV